MQDDELALLKHTFTQGWPSNIKEVPTVLQSYWTFREERTVEDDLILKGTRIVIPTKKHEALLKLIHEGHLGLNKCKLHGKETIYWPGLNEKLERLILNSALCLKYSQSKCKQQPSMSLGQEISFHPRTKLATDIFHFKEHLIYSLLITQAGFLLCASYHQLQDSCSKSVHVNILQWLARYFNF